MNIEFADKKFEKIVRDVVKEYKSDDARYQVKDVAALRATVAKILTDSLSRNFFELVDTKAHKRLERCFKLDIVKPAKAKSSKAVKSK